MSEADKRRSSTFITSEKYYYNKDIQNKSKPRAEHYTDVKDHRPAPEREKSLAGRGADRNYHTGEYLFHLTYTLKGKQCKIAAKTFKEIMDKTQFLTSKPQFVWLFRSKSVKRTYRNKTMSKLNEANKYFFGTEDPNEVKQLFQSSEPRPISEIAAEIDEKWKKVSPYARPYLDAMYSLETIEDKYLYDDAESIILYFLSNASGWKGDDAKRIKKELKDICK